MDDRVVGRRYGRGSTKRRSASGCVALLALATLVVAAAAATTGWWLFLKPDRDVKAGTAVEVTIAKGSGSEAIARVLADEGVVRNARMFRLKARLAKKDGSLKGGQYALTTGMPYELVIEKLTKGPNIVYYDVPIPEGFTVAQVAARFAARAHISEDDFLALARNGAAEFATTRPYLKGAYGGSLQGYLFPKTYRIKKGTTARQVIEKMLAQFDAEFATVDMRYAQSKNLTVHDVVTVASIIEAEAKIDDEYPKVSAVIYNRLHEGMRLQMCSTVMYGLAEKPDRLTNKELAIEHPFNTYLHQGLPPGPMGSPGIRALQAAANPVRKGYLYFVLTGKDGSQTFATSYAEFLKAKRRNQEVFGK